MVSHREAGLLGFKLRDTLLYDSNPIIRYSRPSQTTQIRTEMLDNQFSGRHLPGNIFRRRLHLLLTKPDILASTIRRGVIIPKMSRRSSLKCRIMALTLMTTNVKSLDTQTKLPFLLVRHRLNPINNTRILQIHITPLRCRILA